MHWCRLGTGLLVTVLLLAPAVLEAQVLYGSLTGNVTDSTGASISGASVEAFKRIDRDSTTNNNG